MDKVQANIMMGNVGIGRRSPDYFAMTVMNHVLGARARRRDCSTTCVKDKVTPMALTAGFQRGCCRARGRLVRKCGTDVTEGAMREFFNELRRIREEKVPGAESEEKKRSVVAGFALSLESPPTLLGYAVLRKDYNRPEDYRDAYPAKISAVTADDVQRVAQKYLTLHKYSDRGRGRCIGDATKIKPIPEKYGKVTVYGIGGKVVQ